MSSRYKNKLEWLWVIGALVLINVLSFHLHTRIDLTGEKRFTISEPVKKLLRETSEPIRINLFLKGEMPSGFRMLAQNATELLQEFKEYSDGRVQYKIISPDDPIPGTSVTWADTLHSLGILPINLTVQLKAGAQSQYIYPAAIALGEGKMYVVNLYPAARQVITPADLNGAEASFEYNFAYAIRKIQEKEKPTVAYSIGNGEPTGINTYDLVENVLTPDYNVFTIDLSKEAGIPDTFQTLIIVKPTRPFSESEKLKIDQYIMRGGRLLMFVDRLEAEMDSLQIKNRVVAYDRNLNLEDLLFRYGVRINPDLIMDLQSDFLPFDVSNSGQFELLHWNYFPLLQPNQQNVITRNVGLVAGRFVNSMDTVGSGEVRKTILLSTSANSRTIETPALISGSENRNAPVDEAFQKSGIPAGILLEGKFTSLFRNRVSREDMLMLEQEGTPFQPQSLQENRMIIVSDGDIPLNSVYRGQPLLMGINPYTIETQYEYQFANHTFVQNCLAYLVNDANLMEARSKEYKLRLLDGKKVDREKAMWQILNFAAPMMLIVLFGMIYQTIRRRKYRD